MIEQIIEKLKNKNIAILGFGREGKSTYSFIRKYLPNQKITILDNNENIKEAIDLSTDKNITIITNNSYLENLEQYDLIIKAPGVSLKDVNITDIKNKITSQIELLLEVNKKNVIGITGTKGKSTTTSLIYEIIKKQNPNTILAGNIGIPLFSIIDTCDEETIFVIEMSSHQLEFLRFSPHIGIILNLFEDHLDHAGTLEHYHDIKMNMFRYQTENDYMIYFKDNVALNQKVINETWKSKAISITQNRNQDANAYQQDNWIYYQNKKLYDIEEERKLIGNHNIRNIMVSLVVSELLKLNLETTINTINNFETLEYRMQSIGTVDEIEYYVDTLSTIPEATITSIEALKNVNTLIFGGLDRGISYDKLTNYLINSNIEHFICMPTTAHKIAEYLPKDKVYLVDTLLQAVEIAKKVTKKNTICLLSPAASSYEQFKNYQEKGDKFKEYVGFVQK